MSDTPERREGETFLGRWSRRKRVEPVAREAEDARVEADRAEAQALAAPAPQAPLPVEPPPDLPPIDSLTPESDYSRFMKPDVPLASRNAAMKKLFTDPHFNVMDGLDTYIDDYTKADPIPESMLRELAQSKMLGLFEEKKEDQAEGEGTAAPSGVEAVAAALPASAPAVTTAVAGQAAGREPAADAASRDDAVPADPYNRDAPKT